MGSFFSSGDTTGAEEFITKTISENCVVVFSKTGCPYCGLAKRVLNETGRKYAVVELNRRDDGSALQDVLAQKTGARTVPRVFINGRCIGGGTETKKLSDEGKLVPMIDRCSVTKTAGT